MLECCNLARTSAPYRAFLRMRKFTFVSVLLVSLALCVSAEVRLMNGTDQPLVVDIGPSKGVALPVGPALSEVVGSKLGKNEAELLIVRSTDGTELYREEVQTDNIVVINPHGNRLIHNNLGEFQGDPPNKSFPILINATGRQLEFEVHYADGKVYNKKTREPRSLTAVTSEKVGQSRKLGESMEVTVTLPGGSVKTTMKVGGLYLLKSDGKPTIETIR